MTAPTPRRRKAGGIDEQLLREQGIARRIALAVAALLIAALLGPFAVGYVTG